LCPPPAFYFRKEAGACQEETELDLLPGQEDGVRGTAAGVKWEARAREALRQAQGPRPVDKRASVNSSSGR